MKDENKLKPNIQSDTGQGRVGIKLGEGRGGVDQIQTSVIKKIILNSYIQYKGPNFPWGGVLKVQHESKIPEFYDHLVICKKYLNKYLSIWS